MADLTVERLDSDVDRTVLIHANQSGPHAVGVARDGVNYLCSGCSSAGWPADSHCGDRGGRGDVPDNGDPKPIGEPDRDQHAADPCNIGSR